MRVTVEGMTTSVSALQLENISSGTAVMPSGSSTRGSFEAELNTPLPYSCVLADRCSSSRLDRPLKAELPIFCTLSGMVRVLMPFMPMKARAPISRRF